MSEKTEIAKRWAKPIDSEIKCPLPGSELVTEAFELGAKAHKDQKRLTGEPYFTHHCLPVSNILISWGIRDETVIAAALVHDVEEDAPEIGLEGIKARLGEEVARLVDGVTKFKAASKSEEDKETLRKVLEFTMLDPRVAMIKLADRLHNMMTLEAMPPEKQKKKASETLLVYARLAESLGMWVVKTQLEDLAFPFVDPVLYQKIRAEVDSDPRLNQDFIYEWSNNLFSLANDDNLKINIEYRLNGYWRLAEKRKKAALRGLCDLNDFRQINDLISFRVIVDTEKQADYLMGRINRIFSGLVDPDRFDMFVGENTKFNGYSALQTTLNVPVDHRVLPIEVAVVTREEEEFNKWGVATLIDRDEMLSDYVLKMVFTRTGELRFLPPAATGLDFAYMINPVLGACADRMIVDGKERKITEVIDHASSVEIIPGKARRAPPADNLKHCLPATRKQIEEQLTMQGYDVLVERGKNFIEQKLTSKGLLSLESLDPDSLSKIINRFVCRSVNHLYSKLGVAGEVLVEGIMEGVDEYIAQLHEYGNNIVWVTGIDQPGVIETVSGLITEAGGNIVTIGQKDLIDQKKVRRYQLQFVVEFLTDEELKILRGRLQNDETFAGVVVV
jgi:GTP pyrophosphokinase